MTRSVHHFVHFSFGNFKQKVEQGKAFWEAVVTAVPGTKNKSKSASAPDPNLQADVDQYGFLRAKPRYSQYNSGNASFLDCLRVSDPEQYFLSIFDPVIKQLSDGKSGKSTSTLGQKTSLTAEDVAWPRHGDEELHNGPGRAPFRRPRLHRKILKPKSQALGRPRKYPAGEEAYWLSMKRRELARDVEMEQLVDLTGLETPLAIAKDESTQPGLSRSSAELVQGPNGESTIITATAAPVPANEDGAQPVKRARKQAKKFGETYDHSTLPVPESVDNKWNEAVVRFMDRSNPGMYVSPRGRRKPDGRKGRPPLSRIAVFKNPRLYEFPWFDPRKSRAVASDPVPRPTSLQVQTPRLARTSWSILPLARKKDWTVSEAFETSIYPRVRFITSSAAHSHSLSLYAFKLAKTSAFSVQAGDPVSSKFSKRKKSPENKPVDSTQVAILDDKYVPGQVRDDKTLSVPSNSTAPATKRRRLSPQKSVSARATRSQGSLGSDVTISTPLEVFVASDGPSKDVIMADASAVICSDVPPAHPVQQRQRERPREIVSDDLAVTDLTSTAGDQRRTEGREVNLPVDPSAEDGLTSNRLDLDHAPYEGPSKTGSFSQSLNLDEHLEQTQESITSQEVDQTDSDKALPDIEVQENVPTEKNRTPRSKAAGRIDPWGGSMALLRRKILMDIIDKCGGVFPGDNELWYPFSTQWEKIGRDTSVDRRTIKSIIKHFVDNAKLRQLKFSFKDHKGVMVTRTIITKIEIPPTDAKVKEVQKKMIKEDPQPYFPPGAEVDPAMRMRSDILTIQEIRNNPDRRPREVPLDLKTQVTLDSLPMKYQITERRRRQKEEQQRQRALQKLIPPKLRRLMPKGFVDTSGAGPSRRITVPTKRNVARLQKLNVRLAKPQRLDAPRDIGISQLDYLETEQGRLAPMAGATGLPPPRDMFALDVPQSLHIQDSALISHPAKWLTATQPLAHQELHTSPVFQTYTFPPRQRRLSTETSASSSTSASTPSSETRVEMPYHSPHQAIVDLRKSLPKSLDEFVSNYKRDNRDLTANSEDPHVFNKTVDKVLKWELKHPEVFEERSKQIQFINHEIKGPIFTPAPITPKESLPKQNRRLRDQQKKALAASGSRPHSAAAKRFAQLSFGDVLQVDTPGQPISTIEPFTPLRATLQPTSQPPAPVDPPKRRNRKTKGPPGVTESPGTETVALSPQASAQTVERPVRYRGNGPILESLPETVLHRVLIAMLVTRTVMGGVDSALNWNLMERLFPDLGLDLLKKLWPRLQKRYHARMPELKVRLQERFIEAYEEGDVPSINFDDVDSYPWDELVDWAVETLELPSTSKAFTLPSSRAQLERSFDYLRETRPSSSEMYSGYAFVTHPERQEVLSAVVFASPGDRDEEFPGVDPFLGIQKPANELLLLAKSWVRQNAATPENIYSPQAAKEKLMKINLRNLDAATKSLNAEKVIVARSRQKNAPGRTWDVTEQFLSAIDKRRIITAKMICRSAWYKKNVLELDFAEKGYSDVNVVSDDGDVLTILHLLEDGLITLSSDDVPGDELGLFHETKYQTRQMDKNLLHFSLKIQPGPCFATIPSSADGGITLAPPKPRPYSKVIPDSPDFTPSLLPLWYDVHGKFFRLMWDMLICAICGLVVLRPGLTLYEIQDQLKPVMELWELRACVDWLLAVGLLSDQADRGCFRVTHGWWLRLGEYLEGDIEWEGENGEVGGTAEPISWLTGLET
jgi:hypothetical protein